MDFIERDKRDHELWCWVRRLRMEGEYWDMIPSRIPSLCMTPGVDGVNVRSWYNRMAREMGEPEDTVQFHDSTPLVP